MEKLPAGYIKSILEWRREKEESLSGERSWLALEGLYWLKPGQNSFGSAADNLVVLSTGPSYAGEFEVTGNKVTLHPTIGAGLRIGNQPAQEMVLAADVSGEPTILSLDSLDLILIQRGNRFGIRVWNKDRPDRVNYVGRRWYPVRKRFRIQAQLQTQPDRPSILLQDVTGLDQEIKIAGNLIFEFVGRNYSLLALDEGDGSLFIIFRDLTSQNDTYPAGRYLYTAIEPDGSVILDFNRAYNPPCAFTEFATCPLPPAQNQIPIRVEAGEKFPPLSKRKNNRPDRK